MLSPDFAILGALLPFLGSVSYARDTLRGKTRPNMVSWTLWTIAPLIAFAAELSQKTGLESLLTFAVGFGPFTVLIASFFSKKAFWKLTQFDLLCGVFSILALILWAITGKGDVAIMFSIISDLLAAIPTIIKSYRHPETESAAAFLTSVVGAILTLFTVKHFIFANYAFTLYIAVVSAIITAMVLFGQRKTVNAKASN